MPKCNSESIIGENKILIQECADLRLFAINAFFHGFLDTQFSKGKFVKMH